MGPRRRPEAAPAPAVVVQWVPGTLLLLAAVGLGAVLGYSLGAGRVPVYLSLVVGLLLAGLALALLRGRRQATRLELGAERGSHPAAHPRPDLDDEDSTRTQKFLM